MKLRLIGPSLALSIMTQRACRVANGGAEKQSYQHEVK